MMISYVLLDPRPAAAAAEIAKYEGLNVLGIEVTVPALAEACSLGNIDPQHGPDGRADRSAIEETWEALVEASQCLPGMGSLAATAWDVAARGDITLATIRADLDAFGSMALFRIFVEGDGARPDWRRVERIAAADKFVRGPWAGREPYALESPDGEIKLLNAYVRQFNLPVKDRVVAVANWLTSGALPPVGPSSAVATVDNSAVYLCDGVAVVESTAPNAIALGYALAPLVVLSNSAMRVQGGDPHLKYTICQWPGCWAADLPAILTDLQAMEAGWGGNPTAIIGSPQGVASGLTLAEVLEVVRRHSAARR